jgi:hypothetical protein
MIDIDKSLTRKLSGRGRILCHELATAMDEYRAHLDGHEGLPMLYDLFTALPLVRGGRSHRADARVMGPEPRIRCFSYVALADRGLRGAAQS